MKCSWEAEGRRRGRQPTQMEQERTRSEYVSGTGTGGMRGRAASALSADATHKWEIGTATGACMCAANDQQPSRVEHTRTRTEPVEAHSAFFGGGQASYRTESALRTAVNSPPAVCVWVCEYVTYMCSAVCLPLATFPTQPLSLPWSWVLYLYLLLKQSLG